MATYDCLWKTTWFEVHDREKFLAHADKVFLRAQIDKHPDGRIRFWQEHDDNLPFLTDEDNQGVTPRMVEAAGGRIPPGDYSDKGPDDDLGMILGFELLDFFLPDGQIVVVTAISHMRLDIGGNAWAWKKGLDRWLDVVYLNLEEIFERAGDEFGVSGHDLYRSIS